MVQADSPSYWMPCTTPSTKHTEPVVRSTACLRVVLGHMLVSIPKGETFFLFTTGQCPDLPNAHMYGFAAVCWAGLAPGSCHQTQRRTLFRVRRPLGLRDVGTWAWEPENAGRLAANTARCVSICCHLAVKGLPLPCLMCHAERDEPPHEEADTRNKNTNNEPLVGMSSENFACPRDRPTPAINTPDIRAGAAMFQNGHHGGFNSQLIGAAS